MGTCKGTCKGTSKGNFEPDTEVEGLFPHIGIIDHFENSFSCHSV